MIVPDVNILIYAYNIDAREHLQAEQWWRHTLESATPVGLPWVTILGFLRLITHRSVFQRPFLVPEVIRIVQKWLALPDVQILTPGEGHGEILFRLIEEAGTAGDLTTDAHLAALAMEHHAELVSADTDFARFPGLRWFNPVKIQGKRTR